MNDDVLVRPLLRVVANGRRRDKDKTWLRLTVVATPEYPRPGDSTAGTFALQNWPAEMAQRARDGLAPFEGKATMTVLARRIVAAEAPSLMNGPEWDANVAASLSHRAAYDDVEAWKTISAQWQDALAKQNATLWVDLATDIRMSMEGKKRDVDLQGQYAGVPGGLALDSDGAIVVSPPQANVTIKGVVPIRQTDLAIEEESMRATRVLAKQFAGPAAVPGEEPTTPEADDVATRFKLATEGTDFERRRSKETRDQVGDVLKGNAIAARTVTPQIASPVPNPADVIKPASWKPAGPNPPSTSDDQLRRRQTHQYGTWLQRSVSKKGSKDIIVPGPPTDESQAVLAAYFALQGDPTLSRLFCLVFDLEIEEGSLGLDGNLHLAVAPPAGQPPKIEVATAAKLHPKGFWPVSAFEAFVTNKGGQYAIVDQPKFIEQRDGIWRLGATMEAMNGNGHAATVPRYDLISLETRQSLDSKVGGSDRGEPHHTGGLTLLDRGRSDQIARDLAFAALQTANLGGGVVVLHAEELTTGRRVAVAAAKADTPLNKLVWRSLMHRYVDFNFRTADKIVESVLTRLFPDRHPKKGILEEISFQVAARYMPTSGADSSAVEVVAEEAIFSWDGTPAGVLTDVSMETKSELPFGRKLDLPGEGKDEAELRPAPLRFGVPYELCVLSTFLGGGGPRATDSDTLGQLTDEDMLPPGEAGCARPRRFLRHERIAPPTLMLPRHLAERRYAEMGYEQLDQAIIRSVIDADAGLPDINETATFKGAYVPAPSRAAPHQTMRVFVPPEAAVDLVKRHGKLDRSESRKIRKGGLRDVSFAPTNPRAIEKDGSPVPSGFPAAVVSKRSTLDGEGAVYRRLVQAADVSADRGAPVFEAGGLNTTKDGDNGFLPDPAIDAYSIRARIRGCDRYLSGHINVPLYSAVDYPDALPLVIDVVRPEIEPAAKRPAYPTAISCIAAEPRIVWLRSDGTSSMVKTPKSTRVQFVRFTLWVGEDYDLEIACLPCATTLAGQFSVPESMAVQMQLASSDPMTKSQLSEICGDPLATACTVASAGTLTGLAGIKLPSDDSRQAVADRLLAAMQNDWPIEEIAGVAKLRICHAINKPVWPVEWQGALTPYRRSEPEAAITKSALINVENAANLLLDGQVCVDLGMVDSFQVIAETTGADGKALDSQERARSSLSKRSGRWPAWIRSDGNQSFVSTRDLLGFDVAVTGEVTLPRHAVALLKVSNLPTHGAVGEVTAPITAAPGDPVIPIFTESPDRRTHIGIAPLLAAAGKGVSIEQKIAMPPDAKDILNRTRNIKVERPHIFKDTHARLLKLSVVAVSRFANAFETEPTYFEGREQALYRRQPLKRADQALISTEARSVWMQSTARPAKPDVRSAEPSFVFERNATKGDCFTYKLVRHARTRLYLGRGWFSSGEGERLGIVLWPPIYNRLEERKVDADAIQFGNRELALKDFEDRDLGDAGAFVTRWGGDPVRWDKSEQNGFFIPPSAFAELGPYLNPPIAAPTSPHRASFQSEALIPIPKAKRPPGQEDSDKPEVPEDSAYQFLHASLLTYEPCFDVDREEWYVDVNLRPIRASEPFVRFGLVRFQEHSISPELQVSEPISATVQLLPERTVEVALQYDKAAVDRPVSVTVTVTGFGSIDIKDLHPKTSFSGAGDVEKWGNAFDKLRKPKIRLAVLGEVRDPANGLIRTPLCIADGALRPIGLGTAGPKEEFHELEPRIENTMLKWDTSFELDRKVAEKLGKGLIVAYLEEIDRRMPSSYRTEPVSVETIFSEDTFVDSGPRFSARIPFWEIA